MPEDEGFRTHDGRGQLVRVERGYTYRWCGGQPLAVGDRVLLPANWLIPHPFEAQVLALGSAYHGDIADILKRVEIPKAH